MSLKSLLALLGPSRSKERTLQRIVNRLLQSLELHAIPGDDLAYKQFCSDMKALAERFTGNASEEELVLLSGQITTTLKDYAAQTSRFRATQGLEYRKMLSMLTQSVGFIAQHCTSSAARLKDIEKQLEKATMVEDILTLRLRLADCLQDIRDEIDHNEVAATQPHPHFPGTPETPQRAPLEHDTDPVTGLPGRKAAESALREAATSGRTYFAVAIVAGRIEAINSSYGYEFGDRALFQVYERVRTAFAEQDRLFRWRGPAFLALMERACPASDVMHEVGRLSEVKLEDSINIGTRSVFFAVPLSWELFAVATPLPMLTLRIDRFVAAHASSKAN